LERERKVESREKELEEKKLVIDQRERELEDRERVGKEETQRKIEEVERRERELEERRGEFEKEREKWEEERNTSNEKAGPETITSEPAQEWRSEMETLKKEMNLEISVERKKAEERELELETRVMKKVTEILGLDKDEQNSKVSGPGWKKRWDVSIKPLTRKATSSTSSDFGV